MSCSLEDLFDYSTKKEVRIKSVSLGILKYLISASVFIYMCVILFNDKRYQKKDSVISSVHTKVKGVLDVDSWIWDTAEYTVPSPDGDSFFVVTNIIKTEDQRQSVCPEFPSPRTICSRDDICKKGHADPQSNGIQTGKCVRYNSSRNTCEVKAWCPVESKSTPDPAVLGSAENFTVLIKNNIHFAAFNYTTKNILPEYNVSCIYDRVRAPQCPIFRLGDILKEAGENFSQMAVLGGVMGIEINWNCNLDWWLHSCHPRYSFRRLDDKIVDERLYPGLNFRFARYYKAPDGTEKRTLIKAYGIRFDIQVYGTGGKFNWYELIIFIGSYLSYFSLAAVVIDFLIGQYYKSCCSPKSAKKYYDDRKYETVPGPCVFKPLKFVSFVDKNNIFMVDNKLKESLQETARKKGKHVERDLSEYREMNSQNQKSVPVSAESLHMIPRGNPHRSNTDVAWCKCKKCKNRQDYDKQLCCSLQKGECITNSEMFKKLIMTKSALVYALQYDNPLLQENSIENDDLIKCAKEQYIKWRFGSNKEVVDFAIIPSCCKCAIEEDGFY
ncbi:P2X purinoceptor 7 [Rhinophrynus dorsalis]